MLGAFAARSDGKPGMRLVAAQAFGTAGYEAAWTEGSLREPEFASPLPVEGDGVVFVGRQRQGGAQGSLEAECLLSVVDQLSGARNDIRDDVKVQPKAQL